MTDRPIVSIVIAAYQASAFIESSVRSALAQTFADVEVIVIDDGSSDDTATVASSTGDSRVKVVRQQNSGQSAALNRGVAESRGEYIKFLDADDLLNPEHIKSQLSVLKNAPGCVASCRWGYFVDGDATQRVRNEHTNKDYDNPMDWLVDCLLIDDGMLGGWTWLIPRDVWDRSGGWNETLSLQNDFDFSIRVLLASSGVRFGANAIYSYRKGLSEALTGRTTPAAMRSAFETTRLGCASMLAREDSPRVRKACANRWQWWLFRFYPEYHEFAAHAEAEVARLGGSDTTLQGGRILRMLLPVLGWKAVRRIQSRVHRSGWQPVLRWKEQRRTRLIDG